MKIEQSNPPVKRQFTITLDEDELAVLQHALLEDGSEVQRGAATNYDLFVQLGDVMDEHKIEKIEE